MTGVTRALGALGKFWKDFLIGDAPELFVGTLVLIGVTFALHRQTAVVVVVSPLIVVVLLAASVFRGRAKR